MADGLNQGRFPDFLIVGEMKCSTTTLWGMLAQHPDVVPPREKELHMLGSYSFYDGSGLEWDADKCQQYQQSFAHVQQEKFTGEATPNYLFDMHVPKRIYDASPKTPLVAILRDPVKRAYSHYWHQVVRGREKLSFDQALAAEEGRINEDMDSRFHFSYRTRGHYIDSIRRYDEYFPKEQMLILFSSDLIQRPQEVMDLVLKHLSLPPVANGFELPHANKASYPRNHFAHVVQTKIKGVVDRMPMPVRSFANLCARRTRFLRTSRQQAMSDKTRESLRKEYHASNEQLEERIGREVPWR